MTDQSDVINWRRVSPSITTSGQPTEAELVTIRDLGVTHIINLGPHTNKGALPDEPASVAALGLTYIYIPVDFDAPTQADFEAFCTAIAPLSDTQVHVHCIYNARVSAFFYRLDPTETARARMDSIWRPGGVWAKFIGNDADASLPNRYAGYDYQLTTGNQANQA